MQSIKIKLKEVYGETKAYPACPQAQLFAEMLGTKTLTHRSLCYIERLGYQIDAVDAFGFSAGQVKTAA